MLHITSLERLIRCFGIHKTGANSYEMIDCPRILAQVSCEVQPPKATRPNEGLLFLNIELSPMGAPHFEVGRQSELAVQLNRLLEKCIKDSRCVDLESLCIVSEEKVNVHYFIFNIKFTNTVSPEIILI